MSAGLLVDSTEHSATWAISLPVHSTGRFFYFAGFSLFLRLKYSQSETDLGEDPGSATCGMNLAVMYSLQAGNSPIKVVATPSLQSAARVS